MSPNASPVPSVVGVENDSPDGAVVSVAISNACADDDPMALAA